MSNSVVNGILLVNKPRGVSSADVIRKIKKMFWEHKNVSKKRLKIGHGGTLDPEAVGLLVIGLGRHTKALTTCSGDNKRYETVINLKHFTTTDDVAGEVIEPEGEHNEPSDKDIDEVLEKFKGEITQTPSKFSAIRINGKRAYELARKGEDFKMKSRQITIHNIKKVSYKYPELKLQVYCSKGTYIRTLGRDIGTQLGVGGHLTYLNRLTSGNLSLKNSFTMKEIEKMIIEDTLQENLIVMKKYIVNSNKN